MPTSFTTGPSWAGAGRGSSLSSATGPPWLWSDPTPRTSSARGRSGSGRAWAWSGARISTTDTGRPATSEKRKNNNRPMTFLFSKLQCYLLFQLSSNHHKVSPLRRLPTGQGQGPGNQQGWEQKVLCQVSTSKQTFCHFQGLKSNAVFYLSLIAVQLSYFKLQWPNQIFSQIIASKVMNEPFWKAIIKKWVPYIV